MKGWRRQNNTGYSACRSARRSQYTTLHWFWSNTAFLMSFTDPELQFFRQPPGRIPEYADYFLICSICSIIIKTYGSGFGGFGSAGNYWEAYLTFDNLSLSDIRRSSVRHFESITSYAKVKESPVNLGAVHI